MSSLYNFTVKTIKNTDWDLSSLKGKVVLIANVASKCGLAGQYAGLESLYQKYKDQGFEVIGVPCNQFLNQEPGSSEEIEKACKLKYDITFPLLAKLDVNGANEAPLYKFLKESKPGLFNLTVVKWNFEKFLIDKEGQVYKRYTSTTEPSKIAEDIEELLKK
ncbi:thioredoxin-like protein [Thamnidium elegans]|nr:thioredoxin-like protein [Thamnidium elegans]